MIRTRYLAILLLGFGLAYPIAYADNMDELFVEEAPSVDEVNKKVANYKQILEGIINSKIPKALLRKAEGIVVAKVKKGGFVVAIQAGKGLMVLRKGYDWGNPSVITVSSASLGIQAGLESKNVVLVFTRNKLAEDMLNANLKLGAGLDLAVGPLATDVGTKEVFDKEIYYYSDGVGIFAGVSLKGSSMAPDDLANEGLYSKKVTVDDIFNGRTNTTANAVAKLKEMLQEKAPK
ncbi:lipid-binding SYLF domain-containing protein [Candidatus Halobeggiatoa sp. HSG11]|nr:lipid-binding SYLF domain-containing protein [Candidatus Halobeggiatoa sp. HSG11]